MILTATTATNCNKVDYQNVEANAVAVVAVKNAKRNTFLKKADEADKPSLFE